ncbi:hypothetical protein KIP45_21485 [Xanthomonas campestris pv. raphani]|uniref:hypothetical protein n=1 Tax=Xanthomonas campestris TaxID=339 RepID=UPI001F313F7D|nr:hypothetical protein [Xanthomonas campestris]MCF8828573.1 hypothetical protein [Xanthomonas campestris pv. raphani]MEA9935300.1 hypothetical protein [Xanthomonas campestris pv. raphani]
MVHGKRRFGSPETPIQFTTAPIFSTLVNRKFFSDLRRKAFHIKASEEECALLSLSFYLEKDGEKKYKDTILIIWWFPDGLFHRLANHVVARLERLRSVCGPDLPSAGRIAPPLPGLPDGIWRY